MKRLAVAFTGPSNSGKTNLITKLSEELIPRHRVCIIKNDPKCKAEVDVAGKDSARFYASGADVILTSPIRSTFFRHRPQTLTEMVMTFDDFDYLFVEGLRDFPLPKIGVFPYDVDRAYLSSLKALVTDNWRIADDIPKGIDVLNLNNTNQIIEWIDEHGLMV